VNLISFIGSKLLLSIGGGYEVLVGECLLLSVGEESEGSEGIIEASPFYDQLL
jgi:hypothetical protein